MDVILLVVTIPHGHLGVEWSFLLVCVILGYGRAFFDVLGIVFRGKCYMNTLPFAQIGIWGFSFFVSLLTLCFGGPGVLDQGADFTLRDSDVPQTLKKKKKKSTSS